VSHLSNANSRDFEGHNDQVASAKEWADYRANRWLVYGDTLRHVDTAIEYFKLQRTLGRW